MSDPQWFEIENNINPPIYLLNRFFQVKVRKRTERRYRHTKFNTNRQFRVKWMILCCGRKPKHPQEECVYNIKKAKKDVSAKIDNFKFISMI